jgi:hypothetical protein
MHALLISQLPAMPLLLLYSIILGYCGESAAQCAQQQACSLQLLLFVFLSLFGMASGFC